MTEYYEAGVKKCPHELEKGDIFRTSVWDGKHTLNREVYVITVEGTISKITVIRVYCSDDARAYVVPLYQETKVLVTGTAQERASKTEAPAPELDIVDQLEKACSGQPAQIPWPHRLLHNAAEEIKQLRGVRSAQIPYQQPREPTPDIMDQIRDLQKKVEDLNDRLNAVRDVATEAR